MTALETKLLEALKQLYNDAYDREEVMDDNGNMFEDWKAAKEAIDAAESCYPKVQAPDLSKMSEDEIAILRSQPVSRTVVIDPIPNGLEDFTETFYCLTGWITESEAEGEALENFTFEKGHFALCDKIREWTIEWEHLHKGRAWEGEYFDELYDFYETKLKTL